MILMQRWLMQAISESSGPTEQHPPVCVENKIMSLQQPGKL